MEDCSQDVDGNANAWRDQHDLSVDLEVVLDYSLERHVNQDAGDDPDHENRGQRSDHLCITQ